MKVKCDFCDSFISEDDKECPNCGAVNPSYNRASKMIPTTIEELKQWYVDHNLPSEEVTRFFIGKDIKEAKAFGIYRNDEGSFVVYKNKADGSRAVRYEGKDEAYAVNELYMKLKEEIQNQKSRNEFKGGNGNKKPKKRSIKKYIIIAAILVVIGVLLSDEKNNGYYRVNNELYRRTGENWYYYTGYDYTYCDPPISEDEYTEYRIDDDDLSSDEQFENSRFYEENFSSNSDDWDSDSSWDSSDSWDSSGSDWDSDW